MPRSGRRRSTPRPAARPVVSGLHRAATSPGQGIRWTWGAWCQSAPVCLSAGSHATSLADRTCIWAKSRIEQGSQSGLLCLPLAMLRGQFRRFPPLANPPIPFADGHAPRWVYLLKLLVVAVDACCARERPAYHARQMIGLESVLAIPHWSPPRSLLSPHRQWSQDGGNPKRPADLGRRVVGLSSLRRRGWSRRYLNRCTNVENGRRSAVWS